MPPPPTPADTTIAGAVRALDPRSDIERDAEGLDGLAIAGGRSTGGRGPAERPATAVARADAARARAPRCVAACRSSSANAPLYPG